MALPQLSASLPTAAPAALQRLGLVVFGDLYKNLVQPSASALLRRVMLPYGLGHFDGTRMRRVFSPHAASRPAWIKTLFVEDVAKGVNDLQDTRPDGEVLWVAQPCLFSRTRKGSSTGVPVPYLG